MEKEWIFLLLIFLIYFFEKSGARNSTLVPFLKQIGDFNSFISPLSHKRALVLFLADRGDEYLKIIFYFSIPWNKFIKNSMELKFQLFKIIY